MLRDEAMYYHAHIFDTREFKNIRSVWNIMKTREIKYTRSFRNGRSYKHWWPILLWQALVFIVYYKYYSIDLYTICTVSWCMIPYNNMDIYWISRSSNTPGHYGMAGHIGMAEPFYNNRSIIFVVHCEYAISALYTTSIVCWGMIRCINMRIYLLSWSLKTPGQFEMAGQMGMEEPFYNDRPIILQDYYKYAIISVYTTSIVY